MFACLLIASVLVCDKELGHCLGLGLGLGIRN